jgi:NADP-dependent 3-hydroxy acid dehydrogenase YdfG
VEARILEEVPKARVLKIALDVTDATEAEAAVARTVELFGSVDVLVAAAGRMRAAYKGALCILITGNQRADSEALTR